MAGECARRARQVLAAIGPDETSSVTTYANARLTDVLSPDSIRGIVQDILHDDAALAEVAARSYTHSNGFDKITLISSRLPEFKLRLHAWWATDREGQNTELVHNHRWHFRSSMLCGRAHLEIYEERTGGAPVYRHEYEPRDDNLETYGLRVVGPSTLASDLMLTLTPGCTYAMGPDLLHRVIPAGDRVSLTAVVRWATTRSTAWVFADAAIQDDSILRVPSFTPHELQSKLENVVATLDQIVAPRN